MDAFNLIQDFFTHMRCNFCSHPFSPEDIQLIRQDDSVFIVNVYCNQCDTQNGVAMVGLETSGLGTSGHRIPFDDPELTEEELERLADFQPISDDDVLDAHHFFSSLDGDWMKFIPAETLERCTAPETESQAD